MARPLTDIDTASVHLLLSVVDLGSISAAAQRHGLSQPSASRRIRDLERRLGVHLVERSRNGARLTANGARLLDACRNLIEATDGLAAAAATSHQDGAEPVRLAASPMIARHDLPGLCRHLSEVSASLLDLATTGVMEAAAGLRDGSFDLALVDGPNEPVGVSGDVLRVHDLVAVVGPGHRWSDRNDPVSVDEATSVTWLLPPSGTGTRDVIDEAVKAVGASGPLRPAGTGPTDHRLAIAALGAAPAMVRSDAADRWVSEGVLRAVPTDLAIRQPVRLCWQGKQPASSAAWAVWHRLRQTSP